MARYNHLMGRLRGRQITMEEATELFAIMQAMLRAAEAARRTPGPPSGVPAVPSGASQLAPTRAAPSAPDDMFLVGLLAMGAGAGLLAAMARRLSEAAPPRNDPEEPPARRSNG